MNAILGTPVSRHHWWMLGVRGLLAVIFGLAALLWTGLTLLVLVYLFGAYALVNGVMAVIISLQERQNLRQWWVLLLEGLVGIAAGVVAFAWPAITALALLFLIAFWAIVTGFLEIAAAFSGLLPAPQKWMLGLTGVLSVLLGVFLVIRPGVGILSLMWVIGIYALIIGVLFIIRAFQLRTATAT